MHERDRRLRGAGSRCASDVTRNDAQQCASISRGEQLHLVGSNVLICRGRPLLSAREVHPELKSVEESTAHHKGLWWRLNVQDAAAGRHPLRVAIGDATTTTIAVTVIKDAINDVGHRLKSAVRMPRRPLRLARRVLNFAELVEHDEWVDQVQWRTHKGPADGEAFTLKATRCGSERDHRSRLLRE